MSDYEPFNYKLPFSYTCKLFDCHCCVRKLFKGMRLDTTAHQTIGIQSEPGNLLRSCKHIPILLLFSLVMLIAGCAAIPRYTRAPERIAAPIKLEKKVPSAKSKARIHSVRQIPVVQVHNQDTLSGGVSSRSQIVKGEIYQTGISSYYAKRFHGHRTASGDHYDNDQYTAAHRTLPFNTYVRVTNTQNSKSVILRINDRGPHSKGRIIDVSYSAAKDLNMIATGIANVTIEVMDSTSQEMIDE